jgi:REP element-mobilizing transposase RayT
MVENMTLHYVMIREIEGQRILRDTLDRKDFVTRLGDLSEQTGTRILAWPLLGNHVHGF